MKLKSLFILATFAVALPSCEKDSVTGSGNIQTVQRQTADFTKVATRGSAVVHIEYGTAFEVKVKGYANLLPYLKTTVENGVLNVRYENTGQVRNDNTEVFITMPVLTGLFSSGSGDMHAAGDFGSSAGFEAEISGSADIFIEKAAVEKFVLRSSGSGSFGGFGFKTQLADVEISGSGEARLTVDQKLTVKINGSGSVYYQGSPSTVDNDISGSGKVIKQ
ncbi:MAG: DUF2807 domain-containing protein [Chitinophagaceae bacterium]|nr:DUF2807 domain-containing protein [Chitinophagaceae bacterium]